MKTKPTALEQAVLSHSDNIIQYYTNFDVIGMSIEESSNILLDCISTPNYDKDLVENILRYAPLNLNLKYETGVPLLVLASFYASPDILELIIEHPSTDVNACVDKIVVNGQDMRLWFCPLAVASSTNKEKVVDLLLKHPKINVNIQNVEQQSSLHIAIMSGHINIVKKLLKHPDINVNAQNNRFETPLILSIIFGRNIEISKMLLKKPMIDVNLRSDEDKTAFMYACEIGHIPAVEMLMKHKDININEQNYEGKTSLMIAIEFGEFECAKMLLNHPKIDTSLKTKLGKTAWDLAKSKVRKMLPNLKP